MNNPQRIVGGALAAKNRINLFDDPRWEERFEILIRLTQRTQLIQELTGTDVKAQRIKDAIDRMVKDMGVDISRPRGLGQSCTSKGFLAKTAEKYDAAYLIALHFGANGYGASSPAELNHGAALDKRMETYMRYRSDLYENPEDARVSFESYVVLIDGIKSGEVSLHQCKDCSSRFAWTPGAYLRPSCPVCSVQQLEAAEARDKLKAFVERRNQSRMVPARLLAVA